jgi:hypothetical protein
MQQSANRGRIHVVGSGNVSLRLAGSQPGKGLLPLMGFELWWAVKADTPDLRSLAALSGASTD